MQKTTKDSVPLDRYVVSLQKINTFFMTTSSSYHIMPHAIKVNKNDGTNKLVGYDFSPLTPFQLETRWREQKRDNSSPHYFSKLFDSKGNIIIDLDSPDSTPTVKNKK